MRQIIFSVYDIKANAFMKPFFEPQVGLAERTFMQACMEEKSPLHMYPADFTLFEIGNFEMETAEINTHPTPLSRGSALSFISAATEGAKLVPQPEEH